MHGVTIKKLLTSQKNIKLIFKIVKPIPPIELKVNI